MKKVSGVFIILGILFMAISSYAGDVVYTMWEDDHGQFWVRIQNDTDRSIVVENIVIVFYNQKGKPIEQRPVPCKKDCRLPQGDTHDFGAYDPPPATESARVRNVKYSVE